MAATLRLVALVSPHRVVADKRRRPPAAPSAAAACTARRAWGYVGSQLNSQIGTAARIGALRRAAPDECQRVPALIAAEVPILTFEAALAALASFTLVGPLGLLWWLPLLFLGAAVLLVAGQRNVAAGARASGADWRCCAARTGQRHRRAGPWSRLFAQIARNWLMLGAAGVDASVFDATAVLIAMITLSQLPVGPGVGAAAVVLILGADGGALAAAANVLLTATGTLGALAYAGWAGIDRPWTLRPRRSAPPRSVPAACPSLPRTAAGDRSHAMKTTQQHAQERRREKLAAVEKQIRSGSLVEGLQDAVHRDAGRHEERMAELERKTEPEALAKALRDDTRRRGL